MFNWFNNLKWVRAIRQYDFLIETTRRQAVDIGALKSVIHKYERGNPKITQELPADLRCVFETHRNAARQSINDACAAEERFRRKLLDDKDSRRPSQ